mmetsp:Transcript_8551/g.25317  ORF Transcript_8551/g.25317 Transcript_8551/m.25317 type:complete len:116 (+) Transcript_8551:372-719(+)|eukprot:CAMPEP_0172363826 /NCGR_PEP_ID=MMETSP1060-20121228/7075_1 /TAXON_ID=37318 /ORGANISM="Pseudo-nitzschia pungens, Strain cf. cingulata" /LENGTH=115 /DNA_ID=CAMNT_0013086665 /DNA_START=341 /DNA_END=688 /DNA_ORIENTATION=+
MMTPAESFRWVMEAIRRLFNTPIAGWTWGQWFLAFVLLSLVSSCCGGSFLGCRRRARARRYRGSNGQRDGYYYYASRTPTERGDDESGELPPTAGRPSTTTTTSTTPYRLAGEGV